MTHQSKRIGLSLFDDDVRQMIESGMSIVPITQDMLDNNLNPNEIVYGRLDRRIYMWLDGHWDYIIADDIDVNWIDIKGKPTSYVPVEHTHSSLHEHTNKSILDAITQLLIDKWNTITGKADKTYVDTELDKKSDITHNHDTAYSDIGHGHNYSLPTHLHDDKYSQLGHLHSDTYYTETEVDAKLLLKSDTTHNHDGAYWTKTTPLPKGDKGDKPSHQWTGTSLAFENPNGSMGVAVDLQGKMPEHTHEELHSHSNKLVLDSIYEEHVQAWNTVVDKADLDYVNTQLNNKASTNHTHDAVYSALGHIHDTVYSALGHIHDDRYYTQEEIDTTVSGLSKITHNHDGTYYKKAEVDSKLSYKLNKAIYEEHVVAESKHITLGSGVPTDNSMWYEEI